jgi:hypothetical protein
LQEKWQRYLLAQLLPDFFSAQQENSSHVTLNSDGQKTKQKKMETASLNLTCIQMTRPAFLKRAPMLAER